MKEQQTPTKRTLDDCSTLILLLQKRKRPLSFTDFKKTFKAPINNKLITTALNLLIEEQLIEKKLVDGKIRYIFSNSDFESMVSFLQTPTPPRTILKSESAFTMASNADNQFERILFIQLSELYIQYFLKNEVTKIEHTRPTYYVILSFIHKKISQLLFSYLNNNDMNSVKWIIEKLEVKQREIFYGRKATQSKQDNINTSDTSKFSAVIVQESDLLHPPKPMDYSSISEDLDKFQSTIKKSKVR